MFLDFELGQLLLVGKVQGCVRTILFMPESMPPPGLMLLELAVTDSCLCFRCCLVPSGASAAPAAVQPPFKDQVVPWYRGLGGGVARLVGKHFSAKSVKVMSRAV